MLGQIRSVGSQGDPELTEGATVPDFSSRLGHVFQAQIILPLMGHAGPAPAEVQALINAFRDRLETLESLLSAAGVAGDPGPTSSGHHPGSSGSAPPPSGLAEADDIGRNQRSRVRELVLLASLEAEHHALPLQQITRALKDAGFDDSSAAIVSQLHRLKKLGVIAQPANGMYVLTPDGVLHVRELRKNFGHLARR